jgi:hypothetical protein
LYAHLACALKARFVQRSDLHARQLGDGRYVCIRRPLAIHHLIDHLGGGNTLGTYVLDKSSRARFLVLDADDDAGWQALRTLADDLQHQHIHSYCEDSRRGGHLWFFFEHPMPAAKVRQFGKGLIQHHHLPDLEVFPKQDRLSRGPGSLVRLPFGIHRKSGKRYGFVEPNGRPLGATIRQQIELLAVPEFVPNGFVELYSRYAPQRQRRAVIGAAQGPETRISERAKGAVGLSDFVGQFVELSATGMGHCPFHDDEVASFSVNEAEKYWYCFGCQRGGSIIDFWMHYRNYDFRQAIRELAQMLEL